MLGTVDPQVDLLDADQVCGHLVPAGSFHRHLAELGDRLFSDSDFADLYDPARGRQSVPPSLLAKILLLQSLEGTSDRETLDRVRCDLRWKVALHLSLDDEGFHPTVLVYFRERLRCSERPRRIFDRFKEVAKQAGLLSAKGTRVLDSTPVLSAVQTQDTVSLIRGALRRLLLLVASADPKAKGAIEAALHRTDYDQVGKPAIDWDDEASRAALVDELVVDATAALQGLEGARLAPEVQDAVELLATVAAQDVDKDEQGRFRIRRGVARDRVISSVDPEARHGRKSNHGPFDGYKAHVAVDLETELVTEVQLTPANVADSAVVEDLLPELGEEDAEIMVVADSAYGSGPTRAALAEAGATLVAKAPPEQNTRGGFPKSAFAVEVERGTAICPAGVVTNRMIVKQTGEIEFRFPAETCARCRLRDECTTSSNGRSVSLGPHEALLAEARAHQRTEEFKAVYNAKRPTVERVISRVVRRGGRKARCRGRVRVREQLAMKAAAENLLRMVRLGLTWSERGVWVIA